MIFVYNAFSIRRSTIAKQCTQGQHQYRHAPLIEQIQRAYQLAFSRSPSAADLADVQPVVAAHGLATLCRALFNSNEFLFVP